MKFTRFRITLFALTFLGALFLPLGATAQVEESRVRVDGMV